MTETDRAGCVTFRAVRSAHRVGTFITPGYVSGNNCVLVNQVQADREEMNVEARCESVPALSWVDFQTPTREHPRYAHSLHTR